MVAGLHTLSAWDIKNQSQIKFENSRDSELRVIDPKGIAILDALPWDRDQLKSSALNIACSEVATGSIFKANANVTLSGKRCQTNACLPPSDVVEQLRGQFVTTKSVLILRVGDVKFVGSGSTARFAEIGAIAVVVRRVVGCK